MKLPAEILDDRIAIVGTSGSGKTVTGKLGVEALLDDSARVCVVDPLGVWWGLRTSAKGDSDGYAITIFGGEHGDLPISENAGSVIGEAIATGGFSCIIDLSGLPSQAKRRKFMKDFAEQLYASNRDPLHLILDEADLWVPQKPIEDIAHILGARIDEIVRRGRVRGFTPWLITQRPAVIHKDVLSQLDTLIAMKLTSSQDRNALDAWIEGQADRAEQKRIYGALPSLAVGEGILWSPGHSLLRQVKFSMIRTFDSSRQPKRGERVSAPSGRARVDLEGLRAKLATVEQETAANDPKALRKRIAELEKQMAAGVAAGIVQQPDTQVLMDQWTKGNEQGYREGVAAGQSSIITRLDTFLRGLETQASGMLSTIGNFRSEVTGIRAAGVEAQAHLPSRTVQPPMPKPTPNYARPDARPAVKPSNLPTGTKPLAKMERTILSVLAQYPRGLSARQIEIHTTHTLSGGAGASALARMRAATWIETGADRVNRITDLGLSVLGHYDPLPTGAALREHWLRNLNKMEATLLSAICDAYPGGLTTADLAERTGHVLSGGSGASALAKLRGLGLVSGKPITASEELF